MHWLGETVGVLEGPTNTVFCRRGREALVIDPGLNRAAAERIREALTEEGLTPAALLFTHAHADHSGACHYLQKWLPAPAFGPPLEAEIAAAPYLEPIYLSGGAEPLPELLEPFTLAKPAEIAGRITEKVFRYRDFELGVLPLPGHSPGMVGYELGEGILAAGDALILAPFRAKYPIPYLTDLAKTRASLAAVERKAPAWTIPGHGSVLDPEGLRQELAGNRERLDGLERLVLEALSEPATNQEVLACLVAAVGLELKTLVHFVLDLTTVNAILTDLAHRGLAAYRIEGNRLLWARGNPA
ncbi:MAG: MBL fold metallo-hydrolase [Firmicutes bacterium]|nr:MBL fold metallo-hydrolase [Bacillota bacterium]